ncbi:MAG: SRPBCC family protein [Bacteroidetes bacterium]|nr:SRPBCC family protein [Bacteroidota bacterium]MBS1740637.1 SRPBCC family protein [Bacteroidota bacterium]MBS1777137.1 SRPBCC family protein [Bacteroidota bacterium]
MALYQFTTVWEVEAPPEAVWDAIYFSLNWPKWWKDVISVDELVEGNEDGIGSIRRYVLKSPMFYKLSFDLKLTHNTKYQFLSGTVSGQLSGVGSWAFTQEGVITKATCIWHVSTQLKWMHRLNFLLAPIFRYNHKLVMEHGLIGLKNFLLQKSK